VPKSAVAEVPVCRHFMIWMENTIVQWRSHTFLLSWYRYY